jgi:hypothetical protein
MVNKILIHPKLPRGNNALIKINYNYILKLKFGYWRCLIVMEDIVAKDIYNYDICVTSGKYHKGI